MTNASHLSLSKIIAKEREKQWKSEVAARSQNQNCEKKLIVAVIMDHIHNLGVELELAVRENIINKRASVPSWF